MDIDDLLPLIKNKAEMPSMEKESHFKELSYRIGKETDFPISCSTLKRLFHKIGSRPGYKVSDTTKHTLALYFGYNSWQALEHNYDYIRNRWGSPDGQMESGFYSDTSHLILSLRRGDSIIVRYAPDRRIEAEYIGNNQFRVMNSRHSQLSRNDVFTARNFIKGTTFQVYNVKHDNTTYPFYKAQDSHVVTDVTVNRRTNIRELVESNI